MSGKGRRTWSLAAGVVGLAALTNAEPPPPLAWEVVHIAMPSYVWAGEEMNVAVTIRNVGREAWSSSQSADYFSHHWLAPDGSVVGRDGIRTFYPKVVGPGEVVQFSARLAPPPEGREWLVEWEPVREGVQWLGPPAHGPRAIYRVRVVHRFALYQAAFALVTLVLVAAAWALRHRPTWAWWYLALVPGGWCAAGVVLQGVGFLLRSGYGRQPGTFPLEVASAALAVLPVLLVPARWRGAMAALLVLLACLTAFADVIYYRYFGSLVPLTAVHAAGQTGQVVDSVRALTRSPDGLFLIAAGAALVFAVGLWPLRPQPPAQPLTRWRGRVAGVLAAVVVGWPALATVVQAFALGGLASQVFSHDQMLRQWGFGLTRLVDVIRTAGEQLGSRRPDEPTQARILSYFRARQGAPPSLSPCSGAARGMNLVLIQVESLQQWVLGVRVNGVEVTPFLNQWHNQAMYFPYIFDQSDQGRSSDGEFIALNSLHALDRGAVAFRRANNHFYALPAVLAAAGYTTFSAHAYEKGFWNRGVLHPRYGFASSLFHRQLGSGEEIGWGLADHVFFARVVPHLAALPRPFMAFLITLGLHHPFEGFPAQYRVLQLGELDRTPLGNYLHAMHYVDGALRGLVALLAEHGLASNTVVALYGDHDAGLDPDGSLLQLAGWPRRDPSTWPRIDRVPLFIQLPGAQEGCRGEMGQVGGHLDIAPTLLDLLGCNPPAAFLGSSLLGERRVPVVGPYDTAVFAGRVWAGSGEGVPEGGACWALADGRPLPRGECLPWGPAAREERVISNLVLLYDLIPEINRSLAP